jgi:CubicO group peptidase (beta-lactamase class C family)
LIDNDALVGCVIGVVSSSKTRVLAYGEVARGSGAKPNGQTVYEVGSISKAFTGTLLADLDRRCVLSVDDRLQDHLPDGASSPTKDEREITLAHLSTHTSGLPRLPDNMPRSEPNNPYADYDERLLFEFLSNHQLRRLPGEQYEYSHYAAGLLGHILALADERTYEELLVERICDPLE